MGHEVFDTVNRCYLWTPSDIYGPHWLFTLITFSCFLFFFNGTLSAPFVLYYYFFMRPYLLVETTAFATEAARATMREERAAAARVGCVGRHDLRLPREPPLALVEISAWQEPSPRARQGRSRCRHKLAMGRDAAIARSARKVPPSLCYPALKLQCPCHSRALNRG